LNNLALVLADRKEYAAAEAMFRQSLALHRKTNTGVATTLNNLSYPLREQKKYDEATAMLDEAIALTIAADGDQHPAIATFKQNLARVYLARGDSTRAASLLREVLTIRRRVFAANDWRTLSAESMLGDALTGLRQYGEAEALLLHAAQFLKDGQGARGRDFAATRRRLVALYEAQGHPDKAAPYRIPQK
jgi:Tfp pilus assembly protein PilF